MSETDYRPRHGSDPDAAPSQPVDAAPEMPQARPPIMPVWAPPSPTRHRPPQNRPPVQPMDAQPVSQPGQPVNQPGQPEAASTGYQMPPYWLQASPSPQVLLTSDVAPIDRPAAGTTGIFPAQQGDPAPIDLAQLPPPTIQTAPGTTGILPAQQGGPAPTDLAQLPPPTIQTVAPVTPESTVRVGRVNFFRVLKSEWIKLFSLMSTWWVLAITVVVTIAMGALIMYSMSTTISHPDIVAGRLPGNGLAISAGTATEVLAIGQLILSVLAVLIVTNEYSSGQIRSTLTAVPTRWPVLAAKALIIAVIGYVVTFVSQYGAMLVGWPLIAHFTTDGTPLPAGWSITDDRFTLQGLQLVASQALATTLVILFALAVAALLRNTAGSIAVVVGVLFIVPIITSFVNLDWVQTANNYMLASCQTGLYSQWLANSGGPFDFIKSLWVTGIWAVAPGVLAGVLLRTRDA